MKKITVKVTPKSKKTEVKKIDNGIYYISLKATPEKGKANIELLKFLKKIGIKGKIISGTTSRTKIIKIL